jgi:hypothetical protein
MGRGMVSSSTRFRVGGRVAGDMAILAGGSTERYMSKAIAIVRKATMRKKMLEMAKKKEFCRLRRNVNKIPGKVRIRTSIKHSLNYVEILELYKQ